MASNVEVITWGEQALKDHIAWLRAKNPQLADHEITVLSAGFQAGWRDAIKTLKLQGALRLS